MQKMFDQLGGLGRLVKGKTVGDEDQPDRLADLPARATCRSRTRTTRTRT